MFNREKRSAIINICKIKGRFPTSDHSSNAIGAQVSLSEQSNYEHKIDFFLGLLGPTYTQSPLSLFKDPLVALNHTEN